MESARGFKDAIYEQLAHIGKAVSSPRRLELIDLLSQGPHTVEALAGESGQTLANTSQHLQILRSARLVEAEKEGNFVTYSLADDEVCQFFQSLRSIAESHLAEIERTTREFFGNRDEMEQVEAVDLLERVRSGEATVIDVRPPDEYNAGHIAGAISLPLSELEQRFKELPRDREIVAYCRGRYCVLAVEAVELLLAHGFRASRLSDGVHDWKARGLKIAVGEKAA